MLKLSKVYPIVLAIAGFVPVIALAAAPNPLAVDTLLTQIKNSLNTVVIILFILEALFFIWGAIQFIIKADPKTAEQGRAYMLWSVIAMAVTVAAWGFARIIIQYFGAGGEVTPTIPGGIN